VPGKRRSAEEIRLEIASEREQLEVALADLRKGVDATRRPASLLAGALAVTLATLMVVKASRRLRGR
jgi:hypothetical protein